MRILTCLAILLGGCSGEPNPSSQPADTESEPRDMLRVGVGDSIETLVPVVSSTADEEAILSNLFYPLIDLEFDCSVKKRPGIAKSWKWNEDGTVLTMNLRTDLVWSDGAPLTAEDIAFTFELLADDAVASPHHSIVERMLEDGRPKVVDAATIEWHFAKAYDRDTQVSHTSTIQIVPKHVLEGADRSTIKGNPFSRAPVVSGPWMLAKHEPGKLLALEPNPKAPADRQPKLKRVEFEVVKDYNTRLLKLKKGEIDLMSGIQIADADELRSSHRNLAVVRRGYRTMDYLAWNLTDPKFSDPKVRTALAQAVDVNRMITELLTDSEGQRYARPATGTTTPELCGVYNDAIAPIAFSPEAAAATLEEAGWSDSDGDGIRDRDGKPFSFSLLTNTGNERRAKTAFSIQQQLQKVGVEVRIEKLVFIELSKRLENREFEAALGGWEASLYVDPSDLWRSDTPERKVPFNYTSYASDQADALIDSGLAEPDPRAAAPVWKELQEVVYRDQPYLFLWWRDELIAVDKRFTNPKIDIVSPVHHLHEWEVPADKVKYPDPM